MASAATIFVSTMMPAGEAVFRMSIPNSYRDRDRVGNVAMAKGQHAAYRCTVTCCLCKARHYQGSTLPRLDTTKARHYQGSTLPRLDTTRARHYQLGSYWVSYIMVWFRFKLHIHLWSAFRLLRSPSRKSNLLARPWRWPWPMEEVGMGLGADASNSA